jgi:hypothetical protein
MTETPQLVPRLHHVGVRKDKEPALLGCLTCNNRWTQHVYHDKEKLYDLEGKLVGTHDQYKCTTCGTIRRWG